MTLLDDRPTESTREPEVPRQRDFTPSPFSTWRFAARLARRETRRRPGRTLLVMLLVALPVFAMSAAVITGRSTNETSEESFARRFGTADIASFSRPDIEALTPDVTIDDLGQVANLPEGTTVQRYLSVETQIRAVGAAGVIEAPYVELTDIDLTEPIGEGIYDLRSGRAPQSATEVALDPKTARLLGVGVGDSVEILRPAMTLDVVGIVRSNSYFENTLMVVGGFDVELIRPENRYFRMLIDLPNGVSGVDQSMIERDLSDAGFGFESKRWEYDNGGIDNEALAWGWIAGVVAFIAVGIVIAAAFATSARRQLATIGQLSANGAPERLVRRSLGLQGMWTGVLGAAVGIVGAVLAASFGRSLIERSVNHRITGIVIRPTDLIVIAITAVIAATVAALVPARSASKIPVLSALAGRRPLSNPPRWLVPTGVALFAGGLFLLAAATSTQDSGNLIAAVALLGALAVLFGLVCTSPLIVAGVGAVGSRTTGTIRLASRSLARTRTRSAAVMTAIATVMAIGTAGLTAVGVARLDGEQRNDFDDFRTVNVSYFLDREGAYVQDAVATAEANGEVVRDDIYRVPADFDPAPIVAPDLPPDLLSNLETVLPDATITPIVSLVDDPLPYDFQLNATGPDIRRVFLSGTVVVATDALLERLRLSAEQLSTLDREGVLSLAPWLGPEASINTTNGVIDLTFGPAVGSDELTAPQQSRFGDLLVTGAFVESEGLDTNVSRYIVENPTDLTDDQRATIRRNQSSFSGNDPFVESASAPGLELAIYESGGWFVSVNGPYQVINWGLIGLGVGAAMLLLVLLVVAIGLSLAATESRSERDVLHSIGAPPKVLRRVAAAKAYVLTLGAAVVAVPTGFVVVRVVGEASNQRVPTPFVSIIGLVVVVPIVAAIATFVSSAIAQRFRPVTISTLSTD